MGSRLSVLHGGTAADEPDTPESPVKAGKIANTPASVADLVFVLLDDDLEHRVGPVHGWQASTVRPAEGQACAVMQAAQGDWWLVGWDTPTGAASFSAWRSASLSISTNGVIVFDTEEWDTGGWYDTATGLYTPKQPGVYALSARARTQGALLMAQDGDFTLRVQKNGATVKSGPAGFQRGTVTAVSAGVEALVRANGTTDTFDIAATFTTPATPIALATGITAVYFQGQYVGP